jgi:DNA mismatch repair protein MutL
MERRPIQPLPLSLVNRIAAGEVIERPASVVKELVENAIDAGATEIVVETEEGGRQLIRVVDNGSGIPPEDLPLAFAEHATSKLRTDDDLFRIGTMGFRGEALASIGSVSQARVLSRTADSEAAWEVHNRGGEISPVAAAAGNVGTTVEMRELFYNVPARRKFLKGAATESGHVSETLLRLALPHPHIAFRLLSGGRKSLDLPVAGPEQRLLAAWPEEFAGKRLALDLRDREISIRGLVGLPELAHPTARHQYFYLNGRHIRDRFIQHALREAYRGLMEPGRQPAAILLIEMPPDEVDVNVHPAKAEVRFKDSGRLHGLLLAGIREKLLGSDLTPAARPASEGGIGVGSGEGRPDMRARLAEFFKQSYAGKQQQMGEPAGEPAAYVTTPSRSAAGEAVGPKPGGDGVARFPSNPPPQAAPVSDSIPRQPSAAPLPTLGSAEVQSPAIQLHNAYLVTETADGMLIIDQHALHERIMYEELKSRLGRGPLEAQRLLIPETINVSAKQVALLEQIGGLLAKLGIEVASFGPTTVAVQAFPSFLGRLEPGRFVRELLERGEQELLDVNEEEALHEILDMMACKAAIKAGDPLTPQEIEALLARKDLVERASNCPHGRPTTLRLSLRDLEKQFKRTGF